MDTQSMNSKMTEASDAEPVLGPVVQQLSEALEAHEKATPLATLELVSADHNEKGLAQAEHESPGEKDLGWHEDARNVSGPLIAGLSNEELWILIRRFNKQMFHVKAAENVPLSKLDLNIAEDEEFSPHKLQAHLERLYMTIGIGVFAFWKQVIRLRSWRERDRTAVFLAVYAAAWGFDYLVPLFLTFLVVLIMVPFTRDLCFPYAPPALIDSKTGGVKTPMAGVLASDDSMTGAPEKHKGEAVENEAHSFINSISMLFGGTTIKQDPEDLAAAKDKAGGKLREVDDDRTRKPVGDMVYSSAKPIMHSVATMADTYEGFYNALSPKPPFPKLRSRAALASCLLPPLLASCFITPYMFQKSVGFALGFAIFGSPLSKQGVKFLDRNFPRWWHYTNPRNIILRGVPNNAQLTLTLLRIGERNRSPLPPPPSSHTSPLLEGHPTAAQHLDHLGATEDEINEAIRPSEEVRAEAAGEHKAEKPKRANILLKLARGAAKGAVSVAVGADRARAALGSNQAKDRLGAIPDESTVPAGPSRFHARLAGKDGHAYLTTSSTESSSLSWTSASGDVDPTFSILISDIHEVQKTGGLGWKSKILVGWATGKETADGIVIRDRHGHEHHLTAVPLRDELFNRLIAINGQMWESW